MLVGLEQRRLVEKSANRRRIGISCPLRCKAGACDIIHGQRGLRGDHQRFREVLDRRAVLVAGGQAARSGVSLAAASRVLC